MQVPDMIRDAASKVGLKLAANYPVGSAGAVPPEMKQAYQTGDYATIQQYTDIASNDLNPIYGNIQNNAEKAFFQVTNPSDGVLYWLSIAGPTSKPNGYMWSYCAPTTTAQGQQKGVGDPVTQPVAQFGTFSVNSSTLGISNQLWDNSLAQLGAGAIATVVMTTTAKFIQKRIAGALVADAVEGALAEGGAELVAEGAVEAATWVTVTAFVGGLIVGAVVGAVVFFLIMFIVNFVYKAYKVAINIYNWDINNSYVIDDKYTDNAVIDGDQAFTTTTLPSPSNTVTMPDGFTVPTKDTIYQYASIVWDNDSKVFQGLGVAMQVHSADGSTGFQLKYLCSRFSDNTLGLTGGVSGSIEDYYNNSDTWEPNESYSAQATIPGSNVPISCTTTSLGGQSDQFYQFDVHIGLKPSDGFTNPGPGAPKRKPLPKPEKAIVPGKGEEVALPGGQKLKVGQ